MTRREKVRRESVDMYVVWEGGGMRAERKLGKRK